MRFRSDTLGVSDSGQLLPYYRREKYPPGAKSPSVWDTEEEEPVTRLTEEKGKGGNARKAAARIVANAYPGSPVRRMGPATVWDDHEYAKRAPGPLHPAVEDDGEAALGKRSPARDDKAKRAARRLLG